VAQNKEKISRGSASSAREIRPNRRRIWELYWIFLDSAFLAFPMKYSGQTDQDISLPNNRFSLIRQSGRPIC